MAHPFASQAKASQKARLGRLGAKAGKSFGSSAMYKATKYPKQNAGSSTPMTISGGSSKKRPDRMAAGGSVGHKRRPHSTTNIIISHAGGRGGSGGGGGASPPTPVPVPRPVPVPVNAGGPPPVGPGAPVMRPPMAPVGAGAPVAPVRPPMPAGPPPGAVRPPGMKAGGSVKKAKIGGEVAAGKGYKGYPHSPTSEVDDAVSPKANGGAVKKRQFGGGMGGGAGLGGVQQGPAAGSPGGSGLLGLFPGRQPVPQQQGAPNISGRPMIPFQQPVTVPMGRMGTAALTRPAPGTIPTYAKKGGAIKKAKGGPVHSDEAQDKKLISKMIKKEEKAEKKASGGLVGPIYHNEGVGKRKDGGSFGRTLGTRTPEGGPVNPGKNQTARGLAGSSYHQQGRGLASGGSVQAGAGSGVGRLAHSKGKQDMKGEL